MHFLHLKFANIQRASQRLLSTTIAQTDFLFRLKSVQNVHLDLIIFKIGTPRKPL